MTRLKMFFISLLLMIPIIVVGYVISSNGSDDGTTPQDTLVFTGAELQLYDESSTEYAYGKRMQVLGAGATLIDSKLYGEYKISNSGVDIVYKTDSDYNCNNGISYKFTGSFTHTNGWFEDLNILENDNSNYYCPGPVDGVEGTFSMPVTSNQTGKFLFNQLSGSLPISISVIDGYWKTQTITLSDLLNNEGIYVNGAYLSSKNIDKNSFNGEIADNAGNIELGNGNLVTSKIGDFNKIVNKNIELLARGITPTNTPTTISSLSNKNFYYYNYEEKPTNNSSNVNNNGSILVLDDSSSNDILEVNGQKTIIVKGGNIYIKSDIKNTDDSNSILVIVAKRDSNNNKNGGNIYIDPSVTNIDAVLIADGSILNYTQTSGVISNLRDSRLKKQLLIYGAVSTKNTIGSNVAPYGSDHYIAGTASSIYNLLNLRSFQAILSNTLDIGSACNKSGDVVAMGANNTTALTDAFAGRKSCYISENRTHKANGINGLRSTEKLTPVVILYNPLIQTNPPEILKTR